MFRCYGECVDFFHVEKILKNRIFGQIQILWVCFINHVVTTFQTASYNGEPTSFATYLTCFSLN
jgi:hypothetical protein